MNVLRSALLYLSGQPRLRHWIESSSITGRLTARFVAGRKLDDALAVCRRLNAEQSSVALDYLGESVTSLEEASASRDAYITALNRVALLNLDADVSIKLTQFGLDLSEDACTANVDALIKRAAALGNRVEIDMETSAHVDRTLRMACEMHRRYGCVRAVIQAYLYRSERDIAALCQEGVPVRLVKGAYKELPEAAFPKKAEVDRNYLKLMKCLIDCGHYPAIASHDEKIVEQTVDYVRQKKLGTEIFEFQMLYGIRRDLQKRLVAQGYRLRVYVPYGEAWYPYFMRRLAERPANVFFVARQLLKG